MPPRKAKPAGDQLVLGKTPQPSPAPKTPPRGEGAPSEPPRVLRYQPLGQAGQWSVERYDLLAAEMHFTPELGGSPAGGMQLFHEFTHARTKAWLLVRRLFGVAPVVPAADAHPDDLKIHSREEIVASGLASSKEELVAELEVLRTQFAAQHPQEQSAVEPPPASETLELDDELLTAYGFSADIFKVVGYNRALECDAPRSAAENRLEQAWFVEQLRYEKWQKMLAHKMYGGIARDALMNQLYLRRVQAEMGTLSPMHPRFKELSGHKSSFAKAYADQMDELQRKFPELAISNEGGAKGMVSDMIIGNRDYYSSNGGDQRLINAFCTAFEFEWMLRQAVQRPASFRFGLVCAAIEASKGIYDPNFRSKFKPNILKLADGGYRSGLDTIRAVLNEPVVDLTSGVSPDEGDQFEDFKTETSNIQQPTSNIQVKL